MEVVAFLIFFAIAAAIFFLLNYYRTLFSDGRDEYSRNELLSVTDHLISEWKALIDKDETSSYLGIVVGIFIGFSFTYLGGYSGAGTYIFHSALVPGLFFLGFPLLKEKFSQDIGNQTFIGRTIDNDLPFMFALCAATIAQCFATYFVRQNLSFLWVVFNSIAIIAMLGYRIYRSETETSDTQTIEAEDITNDEDDDIVT